MKEFKVAHIVPVAHLQETEENQYHMCLAHLVSSQEYREHFAKMAANGKYVLMDNGAAEGHQLQPDELITAYKRIQPTEIILPDTLYAPGSTIQKSRNFMATLQSKNLLDKYKIMAVPQGSTLPEWEACARIFVKDTRINSIGISKFLNIATRDKYVRFRACKLLGKLLAEYNRYDIEVHLLGCDEGPVIIKMCQKAFPFVRGCDSAFSYLAAQAGKTLTYEDDSRPAGTIDFINGWYYNGTKDAMVAFDNLAGVSNNGYDITW